MTTGLSFKPVKSWVARLQAGPRALGSTTTMQLEEAPAATLLHIQGRLTLEQVSVFYDHVEKAVRAAAPRIVINLTACPFIDSAAIAALLTAFDRARKASKEFVLVGLAPQVVLALEMARLLKAFSVCQTVEEAVSGPAARPGAE
jgi:anti-anti-sigma factor